MAFPFPQDPGGNLGRATSLEGAAMSKDYWCRCHKQMGNDFYFLPTDQCLYYNACERTSRDHNISDSHRWITAVLTTALILGLILCIALT